MDGWMDATEGEGEITGKDGCKVEVFLSVEEETKAMYDKARQGKVRVEL